jgi:hypothetical protein
VGHDLTAADDQAGDLLVAVGRDPAGAADELARRLRTRRGEARSRAVWRRHLALAELRRGEIAAGRRAARRALRDAVALGDPALTGAARATYATALSLAGAHRRALQEAHAAILEIPAATRALALPELAAVELRAGRLPDALRLLRQASRRLERDGELLHAAGARVNAGVVEIHRGEPGRALAELDEAGRLVDAGAELPAWLLVANRAHAHALRGDVLVALELYEQAAAEMRTLRIEHSQLDLDQLQALLRSGASLEILQRAEELRRDRRLHGTQRAELELIAALAARERFDHAAAAAHVRAAERRFRTAGDVRGAAQACVVAAEIALAAGSRPPTAAMLAQAGAVARESGDRALRARARAAASRLPAAARVPQARLGRYRGDVAAEIAVGVARLDRATARGDAGVVLRELRRLRVLRRSLLDRGSTLRAPAGATTGFTDAASIGLRFAVARRDPRLLARVARHALVLCGLAGAGADLPRGAGDVDLAYLPVGRAIWRITTRDGRADAVAIAPPAELVRLARHARSERSLALRPNRTVAPALEALDELDRLLVPGGLSAGDDGAGAVVRVRYAGILAGVPWPALPTLARAPWAHAIAAPVASAAERAGPPGAVSIVVGPDIPNGAREADAVAARYPRATRVDGAAATADAVCAALGHAGVVHVIAHAGRRGDDPTLSWLDLAGSRLTAADLAGARIRSGCVVLSACDAAAPAGDTAAGLISPASSLVGAGAPAVIAATEPVGHGDVHALLERLHAGLAAGTPPHRALHEARAANDGNRAAESFVCLTR